MRHRIVPTSLICGICDALPAGERCPARCARNFVLGAWSSSFKHSRDAGMICHDDWIDVMHAQITKLCSRPECRVLVAVGEVSPDMYLGFIAAEPSERVVYYCFTKELYRRRGIASALFGAIGIDPRSRFAYPASTRALNDPSTNLRAKIPLAVRDPAVARYPRDQRHRSYT
jgi:hypothetical protein